ncbi:MAG: hypothetical protein G01um101470_1071, partial [Parcubacteria group bacterium Gr01-1014_70]
MITQEELRTIMVSLGWPALILASIFILIKSWIFYIEVKKSPFGIHA